MDHAIPIVSYALVGVAAFWAVISLAGALPLLKLAGVGLVQLDSDAARPWLQKVLRQGIVDPQWVVATGFEPRGVFAAHGQVGDPHFIVWQRAGERTYLCVYIVMQTRTEIDIVSMFDEGGLTTGTTKDGLTVPPRPGNWVQAFSIKDAAPLWLQHKAALDFLQQATGQRPSTQDGEFQDDFVHSVRAQVAYVRSIPLWYLRIPTWYFVRRNRLHGKTIEQQYNKLGPLGIASQRTLDR